MQEFLARFDPPTRSRPFHPLFIFFLILIFGALACDANDLLGGGKPNAIITSPPSGSTFHEGEDIAVQSVSTDSKGVVRVELIVDGQVIRTDAAPAPQDQFTLIQTWKATQGTHTIIIRSYNAQNTPSDPAAISIQVSPSASSPGPAPASSTPTSTPAPTSTTAPGGPSPTTAPVACTNNSAFVSDVTVPDGTIVPAGTTVIKTWRLSNNGTCPWSAGYQFVFVSGEAMTGSTVLTVPSTSSGDNANFSVSITAPAAPGSHTGSWRLRSSSGALFGAVVTVKITVPAAPPPPGSTPTNTATASGCTGTPTIAFFNADSTTITAGSSTALRWGAVTNAESVEIDQSIGGVAAGPTGGSQSVSPGSTTTYTMTARCGSNNATRQVTITVNPGTSDITNFAGSSPSATELQVTVNYYYNGDHGASNIFMSAYAEDNTTLGAPGTGYAPGTVSVGSGSATVKIIKSSGAAFTSTQVRVCMYVGGGSQFLCKLFPFTKNW